MFCDVYARRRRSPPHRTQPSFVNRWVDHCSCHVVTHRAVRLRWRLAALPHWPDTEHHPTVITARLRSDNMTTSCEPVRSVSCCNVECCLTAYACCWRHVRTQAIPSTSSTEISTTTAMSREDTSLFSRYFQSDLQCHTLPCRSYAFSLALVCCCIHEKIDIILGQNAKKQRKQHNNQHRTVNENNRRFWSISFASPFTASRQNESIINEISNVQVSVFMRK